MKSVQESINKRALKAGIWYTICNFAIRGINFITTPFFTRLISKSDYGLYSNYASWLSLLREYPKVCVNLQTDVR